MLAEGVFFGTDLRPSHCTPESTRHLSEVSIKKGENYQDKPLFGLIGDMLKSHENRGQSTKKMASRQHTDTAAVFLLSSKTVRGCHTACPAALGMTSVRNDYRCTYTFKTSLRLLASGRSVPESLDVAVWNCATAHQNYKLGMRKSLFVLFPR